MLEQQHTKSIFEQYVLEKQDHPKTKKITPTYLLSWTRTFHSLAYVFLLADQKFLNLRLWWKNRSFVFTTVYFIIFSCIQTNSRIFPRYKNTQILGNLQTVLTALSMETLHFQSSGFFFFCLLRRNVPRGQSFLRRCNTKHHCYSKVSVFVLLNVCV